MTAKTQAKNKSIVVAFCAIFFSILSVLTTNISQAQLVPVGELTLVVDPKNPAPNENFKVTASYYLSNLDQAKFDWLVNGKIIESGVGLREITIFGAPAGESLQIEASVLTVEGKTLSRVIFIQPADVELVWEAETSVAPFYKGKPLPSAMSAVRVVAFPHFIDGNGRAYNANELYYEWETNGGKLSGQNGLGKNAAIVNTEMLTGNTKVTVTVTDPTKALKTKKTITIKSVEPEVLLYERKPLLGVDYTRALGEFFELSGNEITFEALGYYFSAQDNVLDYRWTLNGTPINQKKNQFTLVRDPERDVSGRATIGVVVENVSKFFQRASRELTVRF